MLDISICINVDTRHEREQNQEMFRGVVSRDFLYEGVINKKNLFKGFNTEVILFIDEHEPLDEKMIANVREVADVLVIRKHNKKFEDNENFPAFNDINYLNCLSLARGRYIFHFDGDVAAFTNSPEHIQKHIDLLEQYDYVSYPSMWSPDPIDDSSFGGKYWCSTRFFCCKRRTLDFSEILKCQLDYDYWKETYPVPRLCHWVEHLLSSISHTKGKGVYYPPIDFDNFILFTWENYHKYTLQRLNNQTFEEVRDWVKSKHYHYPCNLTI